MMATLTTASTRTKITGAVLATAALLIALLAVIMTVGSTMAQTDPYPNPKPCGPGQQAAPDSPDATITTGHYAVFDGYWDPHNKTLNLNLCPPSVVHTTETQVDPETEEEKQVEVSTRTASNIDIQQTVFNLDSNFEHTLTATDVDNYDFFKQGDSNDAGTEDDAIGETVWWIRTGDDPMTTGTTETESPLQMGFSAGLFDSQYWYWEKGGIEVEPLQYEFEVIREPGIPIDEQGHFFVFDDSPAPTTGDEADIKKPEWDSSDPDIKALARYPGEYEHFQWAFTKPGTYVISVQLKGHVRKDAPAGAAADWEPISDDNVVTSEVKQYTFHVGTLTLNEEPAFQVERSVEEHSANDTLVGDAIPVYQGDQDPLTYTLTGPGHSLFSVESDAGGNAQIKVVGDLDHEALPEYRLTLGVSDGKDRENNTNTSADSTISVKINVTDQPEAERSVAENSADSTLVGTPVEVTNAGTNTLTYSLSGSGHDLFTVDRDANTGNAQIRTAGLGGLDHEARSTYHLTLSVTGYADPLDDYTIRVTVTVTDVDETDVAEAGTPGTADLGVTIKSLTDNGQLPQTINTGEAVKLWASIGDLPAGATNTRVGWGIRQPDNSEIEEATSQEYHKSDSYDTAGARSYQIRFAYDDSSGQTHWFWSPWVTVTWSAEQSGNNGN